MPEETVSPRSTRGQLVIQLPSQMLSDLTAAAQRRGLTPEQFCSDFLRRGRGRMPHDPNTRRTYSMTAKFTEHEMEQVRQAAAQRGLCPGEWNREVALAASTPDHRALVFELSAIRELLIAIILHLTTDGRELTLAHLKDLLGKADERAVKRTRVLLDIVTRPPDPVVVPKPNTNRRSPEDPNV